MPESATSLSGHRIAVIGAGLSGLAAAWQLARAGAQVEVYEARDQVGGRHTGEWQNGHYYDHAYPLLSTADRRLAAFAQAVGLQDAMTPLRAAQTTRVHRGEIRVIEPQRLSKVAAMAGVSWRHGFKLVRWNRLMARYAPLLDLEAPEQAADLDFRSVDDHVRLYFGKSLLEQWVAPGLASTHGSKTAELSRVAGLLDWKARGTGSGRRALPGLPRRPLVDLAELAASKLQVRLGCAVRRIDEEPAGGFSVESPAGRAGYEAVVVTAAPPEAARIARRLLTPAERDFFPTVFDRPEIVLSVALEGAFTGLPQEVRIPRTEQSHLDVMLLEPGCEGGRVPPAATQATLVASEPFARANAHATDDVVGKSLLAGLERWFPRAAGRIKGTRLTRRATGRPSFEVGAYRALARFARVQADRRALGRRLYWAGDYRVGPTAEAAVASGMRAARECAADLAGEG